MGFLFFFYDATHALIGGARTLVFNSYYFSHKSVGRLTRHPMDNATYNAKFIYDMYVHIRSHIYIYVYIQYIYIYDKRSSKERLGERGRIVGRNHERASRFYRSRALFNSVPRERASWLTLFSPPSSLPSSLFEPGLFRLQTVFAETSVPLIRHFPGRLVYRSAWSLCSYRGVTSPCNRCFRPIFLTPAPRSYGRHLPPSLSTAPSLLRVSTSMRIYLYFLLSRSFSLSLLFSTFAR